jgi:hypothetical protein
VQIPSPRGDCVHKVNRVRLEPECHRHVCLPRHDNSGPGPTRGQGTTAPEPGRRHAGANPSVIGRTAEISDVVGRSLWAHEVVAARRPMGAGLELEDDP